MAVARIVNPLLIVTSRTGTTCHCCDTEWTKTWAHSHYPDMRVCESCLIDCGMSWDTMKNMDRMKRDLDTWDAIAAKLGHDLVDHG